MLQAYQLLESRGLVLARPQSGYYVKAAASPAHQRPRQARYSGSVDINDLVFEVLQASKSRGWCRWAWRWRIPPLPHPSSAGPWELHAPARSLQHGGGSPGSGSCAGPSPAATRTTAWRWIP